MSGLTNALCAFLSLSFRVRGLLAVFAFFIVCESSIPTFASQTDITGPAGSGSFGSAVMVLPNGNFVVTDPGYSIPAGAASVGAVRLYNGATLALISTLTGSTANDQVGSNGVTVLTNGNYVVSSPNWHNGANVDAGAVTFVNGATGVSGAVSTANSLVGSSANNLVGNDGVTALTNGNYVVRSQNWDNGAISDVGAITFGSGTSGISGSISAANSLVGSTANDNIGNGGITALTNGNYVIGSPQWDNGAAADAGAVTFGNGATGVSGVVSAANSLVGSTANDVVGSNGIIVLTNGNYVVSSPQWDNGTFVDAGAATFASGASGASGAVSTVNSLVGLKAGDQVGNGIFALTNGNYVICSPFWDNGAAADAGAATFAGGTTGVIGTISPANSLVGLKTEDYVGAGVIALTNGNYVVSSPFWDNGAILNAGAATFGSGTTGISGTISTANSLIGSKISDDVGSGGITELTNGNYVISTPQWDNGAILNAGAGTFGSGTSGISGTISTANSLVGLKTDDFVGGVIALTNGNYLVVSPNWDNGASVDAGAVTFASGTTGISGAVSPANSLVGSKTEDLVGGNVYPLTNGNYVVCSPYWDNGAIANVGAATFGNGTTGVSGTISTANSLIGSQANDNVSNGGITALTNGNYVVSNTFWDNGAAADAGAATFGNGASGISGTVSSGNSLVGSTASDFVGTSVFALPNGNYVTNSIVWDNGAIVDAGAYTFGNGVSGTSGAITSGTSGGNSVVGTVANGNLNTFAFDATRNRLFVGRSASNVVSVLFFNSNVTADGAINNPAIYDNGLPDALKNAIIPNNRTVSLNGISNIGLVSVDCTANLTGASNANYIVGSVRKNFCTAAGASFVYPLGDPNNYSPLTASNVNGTGALTVSVVDQTLPGLPSALSVSRYWNLEGAGITTNLTFQYTAGDVGGSESGYKVYRRVSDTDVPYPTTVNTTTHTATVTGISNFSPWGIGTPAPIAGPTAASVSVSGRVLIGKRGLTNAFVTLTDSSGNSRTARTSTFGYYRFDEVEAGQTYIVSVQSKRYQFAPQVVNVNESLSELDFYSDGDSLR